MTPGGADFGDRGNGDVTSEPPVGTRPASTTNPGKGDASHALDRMAYVLAIWFGCGRLPAPGTAGTLGAIPLYLLIRPMGVGAVAAGAVLLTAIGIWAADRVARRLGTKDPQIICIDEVAGVFIAWIAAPSTASGLIVGLVFFRVFDHTKPWPARWAERHLPGGLGIVLDDAFASLWAAAALVACRWLGWLR